MPPPNFDALPLNPEFVPGTPEFEEKRARLRADVRVRIDGGGSRLEVEDWLAREGLDSGDAMRLVDGVLRPPTVNRLRETPPDKPVTDPAFAFAAGVTSADHVRAKVARSWYLFRVVAFIPIVLVVGFVVYTVLKPLAR